MLIIFDLDDTLIDTSGSITPELIKKALKKMGEAGLPILKFEETYQFFSRLNQNHLSVKNALAEFLELHQAPSVCYEIGMNEIYYNPIFEHPIMPLDEASEVLEDLAQDHQLALVTRGKKSIQLEKMRQAGILKKFFSRLFFCETCKKEAYTSLAKEMGISPSNIIVCGDRIAIDLAPAKELGFKTVHMRWGRGLGNTGFKKDVDYTILYLRELKMILEQLK